MHNFENLFFIYLSFGDRIFQVLVSALIIKGYYGVDKRILKIQSPEAQLYSSKTGPSKVCVPHISMGNVMLGQWLYVQLHN